MDSAIFTTIDDGTDLVLSLSFDEGTEFGVDGFIIQRTPSLEFVLPPNERGPSIDWTEDDKIILVTKVELSRKVIKIKTIEKEYEFSLTRLSDKEVDEIKAILKKMNFDDNFELTFL